MKRMQLFVALSVCSVWLGAQAPTEDDYYKIVTLPLPADVVLEVGGIAILPDGRPLCCTRRGDVWIIEGAYGDPSKVKFKKFADGLQEPLGLLVHDGWIWFVQRGELSRMRDVDGDDKVDEIETICDAWRISGNYHEYNFGPRVGPDGDLWITTNKPFGGEPFGRADWRGFAVRVSKDGTFTPIACGLRSPAGVQNAPWGDVFYTDNQGEWCGASKLSHLEPGDFHGHPHGIFSCKKEAWGWDHPGNPPNGMKMPDVVKQMPTFKLPAVWFPYNKMGKSPAGLVWDESEGLFGPFAGQVFVSDQHHSWVMRVTLEEVQGHWQGACYPFRGGMQCGIIRVAWGKDRKVLFCGQTQRGWGSKGNAPYGIQRVEWTGEVPFEIHEMKARPDGFSLALTQAIDPASLDGAEFRMESYTYLLHSPYGSPEVDRGTPKVIASKLSADKKRIDLTVEGLRPGYVHELHVKGIKNAAGHPLLHPQAYYTLINIPDGPCAQPPRDPPPLRGATGKDDDEKEESCFVEEEVDQEEEWVDLFDGQTTNGWHKPFDWGDVAVTDGEIRLTGSRKFFLVTEKKYADFILEAEVRIPNNGNSGIQFRSDFKKNRVWGYQAEVDPSDRKWAGGLYDEGRRAWLAPLTGKPEAQAAYRRDGWNKYRIHAEGDHLRIWLNGIATADYRDAIKIDGHIALQHHGEKGLTYRFRNVRIKDLGGHRWRPLFDGKSLDSWAPTPGGKWEVRDGAIVGTSPKAERRHGLLVHAAPVKDFTVRARFKVVSGDSGFYFRTKRVASGVAVNGFQVEIDSSPETGGLYETGGRAWVHKPNKKQVKQAKYKVGAWNGLELSAHGGHIVVKINNRVTSELKADPGRRDGLIALQLHGGQDMHVEYKDIEILEKVR